MEPDCRGSGVGWLMEAGRSRGIRAIGSQALTSRASKRDSCCRNADFVSAEHTIRTGRDRSPLELGLGVAGGFQEGTFQRAACAPCRTGARGRAGSSSGSTSRATSLRTTRCFYTETAAKREIGSVTSAIWSPTCKRNIALAIVDAPHFQMGSTVWAEIYLNRELVWERRMSRAQVVERPFFAPERRRATPPGGVLDGRGCCRPKIHRRPPLARSGRQAANRHREHQQDIRRLHGRRQRQSSDLQGRDVRLGRRLGLRQDHAPADVGGIRHSKLRPDHDRGCGHDQGAPARAAGQHDVPVLCLVSAHDGRAERGLWAAAPGVSRTRPNQDASQEALDMVQLGRSASASRISSRAARGSAWRSRVRSSAGRRCCCSTSR